MSDQFFFDSHFYEHGCVSGVELKQQVFAVTVNGFDPVLSQQQTITHEGPATNEKTTIAFSFTLKK